MPMNFPSFSAPLQMLEELGHDEFQLTQAEVPDSLVSQIRDEQAQLEKKQIQQDTHVSLGGEGVRQLEL